MEKPFLETTAEELKSLLMVNVHRPDQLFIY